MIEKNDFDLLPTDLVLSDLRSSALIRG